MEGQKILAISGRKSSGKNTACNFIHSLALVFFKCTPSARIDQETGELIVLVEEGQEGVLNLNSRDPEFVDYMGQHVWPFIKKFSFADPFKQLCIDCFGLTEEQVYGTDEQKNSLTHLRWEDMPIPAPRDVKTGERVVGKKVTLPLPTKTGFMTAREFMQYIGSEIGREIYEDVWANATLKKIKESLTGIAVVDDCRFPNEVAKVQQDGGKVIRLTRKVYEDDVHTSETELDPENFDQSKFDKVIDNQNMSIEETCEAIYRALVEFGWVEEN